MSGEVRNRTREYRSAQKAADEWIGDYSWTQQAGLPSNLDAILRAMWIHGYIAGLTASRETVAHG